MINVAVFDTKGYDQHYLSQGVGAEAIQWRFHPFRLSDETAPIAEGAGAVCAFVNDPLSASCLQKLADLGIRFIALRCAGFNNIDLDAARELGIRVVRVPAYSPHAVAEHTVALLLTLNRKIHRAYNRVRESNFSLGGLIGFDIHGKTVGIVGTGKIGRLVAEIFRGFGARVVASDPYPDSQWASRQTVRYVELDELIRRSDIVSLHLPLAPETHHLIGRDVLSRMKSGAYLVNTSRGKLIDTIALIEALKSGHVGGVALDVYEEEEGLFFEDLSDQILQDDELSRLLTFPNVLVTSHQAFLTHEALQQIAAVTTENLRRYALGQPALEGTEL